MRAATTLATLGRPFVLCALAAGLLGGATAPGASAQTPDLEEGFFALAVERLPERVVLTTRVDSMGRVLLPLRTVLDRLGIVSRDQGDDLVLEWPPKTWNTRISRGGRFAERGDETLTFAPEEWRRDGGELFVSDVALGTLIGASVAVRWEDLVVTIAGRRDFPAVLRLDVLERRATGRRDDGRIDERDYEGVALDGGSGGLAGNWGLSLSQAGGRERASVRAAVGTSLFGGNAVGGLTAMAGTDADATVSDSYLRYSRIFDTRWVRQFEAGSVLGSGPLARRVTGVSISNRPFRTPRYFGEALISPAVPDGWEYEVYQGDHLVGVVGADERGGVRAPLDYGNTPVSIRMIGPSGQERTEDLLYVLPQGRVRPGAWQYTLGGGRCTDPGCSSYYSGEVARGLTAWATLSAGAEYLADDGGNATRPFIGASFSPSPGMNVELQAQKGSLFRASVGHTDPTQGSLSASYVWNPAMTSSQTLSGWAAQLAGSRPVALFGRQWMTARLQLRGQERSSVDTWQASVTSVVRRSLLSLDLESGLQTRDRASLGIYHTPSAFASPLLQDLSGSLRVAASSSGVESTDLGFSVRPNGQALLNAALRMRRGGDATLSFGVSIRTGAGHVNARTTRGASSGSFVSADGGFAYSGEYGFMPTPYQGVGRAGVAGQVYYDLDADGARGQFDEPVPHASVVVNGRRVQTDAEGRFRSWEAIPYQGLAVDLDPLSVAPEWYSPATAKLRPAPNRFNEVLLPVQRTREVEGRVLTLANGRPLSGVAVEIVEDGVVVATERSFSDGIFYFLRVRPGSYTLRIAEASVRALGLETAPEPVAFEVDPTGSAPIVLDALEVAPVR